MKSIQELIQQINKEESKERKREYDTFRQLDDNILELNDRIINLEKKNLKYFCRAYKEADHSAPTGISTVPLDKTEHPQFGNMHSNTIENTKIWIRRDGVYHISGGVVFAASAAGSVRGVLIRLTSSRGVFYIASLQMPPLAAPAQPSPEAGTSYYLYEGDYLELQVNQNTGVNLDVLALYARSPFLSVTERMEDLDPSQFGLLDPNANTR